jgi:hypothetical protein
MSHYNYVCAKRQKFHNMGMACFDYNYIQGGPTLTIFAITRFLIIEKILRLARKKQTLWSYKPVPLFYILLIGFRVKRR